MLPSSSNATILNRCWLSPPGIVLECARHATQNCGHRKISKAWSLNTDISKFALTPTENLSAAG